MSELDISELPRERFLAHGAHELTTAELLALILGTGMRGRNAVLVAQDILTAMDGVAGLAEAEPRELVILPGVGAARAVRIAAAFHLARRAMDASKQRANAIKHPIHVYERLRGRLLEVRQEVFFVLALDTRNVIIHEAEIAKGSLTHVDVHPREVFRPLIRHAAAAAILAHNHPSGDPSPSAADIALTARLRMAGEVIGIPILDHIIIGRDGYVSLQQGAWPGEPGEPPG